LLISPAKSRNSIEECGLYFGADDSAEEIIWGIRLYILLTECFAVWSRLKPREKYEAILEQIPRFTKSIYWFQNIEQKSLQHDRITEKYSKKSIDTDKRRSSTQRESLQDPAMLSISAKHNSPSAYNQLQYYDPKLMKAFERLEQHKKNYLNCLFDNNSSFKQLILLHKEYETYYKSISKDIHLFLEKNEDSADPVVQKVIKDLKFSNIIAAYLSKITDELTTDKGVQRVRTNILAFFQAAYREYPLEYQKMIETQEKRQNVEDDRVKKNNEEVFVIKSDGIFDKRKLDKLFAPQKLESLNFPRSPRGSNLLPRSQNILGLNSDGKNMSGLGNNGVLEDNPVSENISLKKQKERLQSEIKLLEEVDKLGNGSRKRSDRVIKVNESKTGHLPIVDIYKKHLNSDYFYGKYNSLLTQQSQKRMRHYNQSSMIDSARSYSRVLGAGIRKAQDRTADKKWPDYKSSLLKLQYNFF
jgi:hypothetical protein